MQNNDEYQKLARELKKLWNTKETIIPILIVTVDKRTGGFGNLGTDGNCSNYSTTEIRKNT